MGVGQLDRLAGGGRDLEEFGHDAVVAMGDIHDWFVTESLVVVFICL